MSKLLPNLPIEHLTPETDYLNVIERGDMIKSFLLSNKDMINQEAWSETKISDIYRLIKLILKFSIIQTEFLYKNRVTL